MKTASETHYLILGNGAAAINAVEAIRRHDKAQPITLLAKEPQHAYSRPLITYRLAGKVQEAGMDYRDRKFYAALGVDARLGVEAVRVDPKTRTVRTRDGGEIGFQKLLIATGGSPIKPPIPGLDATGVFTFTTWDDQAAVDEYLRTRDMSRGEVVLGGGLIGLKTVEALVARQIKTTIVEIAPRILAATFDDAASGLARNALAAVGVGIHVNDTVEKVVASGGRISGVALRSGPTVECDMLIVAIGVKPDLELVKGSGIRTDRGIVVDDCMATSAEGIYAAGDVAQALDALTGDTRPIPILPTAARQGRIAGTNMAGGAAKYDGGVPMNAVDVVGLPTISVGITMEQAGDEVLSKLDPGAATYRKIVLRGSRVIGAIFIGQIARAGIFTGLIRGKVDVSAFKHLLLSDEFGLLSLPSDYRAHMVSGAGIEV